MSFDRLRFRVHASNFIMIFICYDENMQVNFLDRFTVFVFNLMINTNNLFIHRKIVIYLFIYLMLQAESMELSAIFLKQIIRELALQDNKFSELFSIRLSDSDGVSREDEKSF